MDDQAAQAPSRQLDPIAQQATPPASQSQPQEQAATQSMPQPLEPVIPQAPQVQPAVQQPSLDPLTSILPQAAQAAAQDQLNPANAISMGKKELNSSNVDTFGAIAQEVPGAQSVEQERTPEISPEVESWMESVDRREERPPEKVVVADKTATNPTGEYAAEPVIVLPLTQTKVQQGMQHPVQDSVKWLAVWCVRIIKKFHGAVVYRPVEAPQAAQKE